VEVVLLQALEDEFGARLEDNTEVEVAKNIMKIRSDILQGDFSAVDELQARWEARKGRPIATGNVQVTERNQDAEWDSVDEESDDDEDGDVDMSDAPALVPAKPKPAPEVDEEGFTKVVGKKRK
jgi:pre-rRNA-processing protein TSR2